MKYCVLGEDDADEAGIGILVDGILGLPGTVVPAKGSLRRRSGGWGSVGKVLPSVLRELYYNTDAGGLVVVLDSDDSPIHQPPHDDPNQAVRECRLCRLRAIVTETMARLDTPGRPPLRAASGLAVPAIEAWWRFGKDPHVGEAQWLQVPAAGAWEERRRLKSDTYGTDRPSLELAKKVMVEEATRIVRECGLSKLEESFPGGFGALAGDLRTWGRPARVGSRDAREQARTRDPLLRRGGGRDRAARRIQLPMGVGVGTRRGAGLGPPTHPAALTPFPRRCYPGRLRFDADGP